MLRLDKAVQYEEKGPPNQQMSQRQVTLPLLGVPHEEEAVQLYHIGRGPRSTPCRLYGCSLSLCEPQ